jgi:O-6-methylguanine DNA methyltransferase
MIPMTRHPGTLVDAHAITRILREMGSVRAPATILPAVLDRAGVGDAYGRIDTPIGPAFIAYTVRGISVVMLRVSAAEFENAFRARFGRPIRRVTEIPPRLVAGLTRHLRGTGRSALRFDLRGVSEFERAVLRKALEIPRGEVRPYAWIAREIGRPRAVRAVGTALAQNPIPVLIPCHRVVRSDGSIGNYGYGSAAKRTVLAAEGVDVETLEALARSGVHYYGSDTTRIYCFPSCRHARRVSDRHRVLFHSTTEAAGAGYRPCRVCRPARAS